MATHLAAFLLESHGGLPGMGESTRIRADHVLLDEADGTVAFLAFEALRLSRCRCELALIAPTHEGAGPDARDDVRYLQQAAASFGARFARPGAGPAAMLHRRRFAVPGRILASATPGASGCGAFGMVHLQAGALECAGALAGEALLRPRPQVIGVRLVGVLAPGTTGLDVLAALARRLEGRARDAWIEYHGPGLASVPMTDRISMAAHGRARLGAATSLFPVDETVRADLRARGREADWRRLEGADEGFDHECELDLAGIPPGCGLPLGLMLSHVRVGPLAEDAELRRLARALSGKRVRPEVALDIIVGGRSQHAALARDGIWDQLSAAGARLLDMSDPEAAATSVAALVCGGDPDHVEESSRAASIWSAAMLATSGEAHDPLGCASADAAVDAASSALDEQELIDAPPSPARPEHGPAHAVPPVPEAPGRAVRGVVLAVFGDDVTAARLLPWGPRAHACRGDGRALAQGLFRDLDATAAARAAAHQGGFLSAGERFGAGEPVEAAARAMAALGVHAVFALSYAAPMRHHLALQGILPLLWRDADTRAGVRVGDELELTGLPEALLPGGHPIARDLTRGLSLGIQHDLDPQTLSLARAGGLLGARARGAFDPAEEGVAP